MQYLLIHTGAPDLAEARDDEAWAALTSRLDETISSGVNFEGSPLRPDADATTVKVRNGELIVTDGPYAETKEQAAVQLAVAAMRVSTNAAMRMATRA